MSESGESGSYDDTSASSLSSSSVSTSVHNGARHNISTLSAGALPKNSSDAAKKIASPLRRGTFSGDCNLAVDTFESMNLRTCIVKSFAELHYSHPTELQKIAINQIARNENVFVECFSGLGMGKRATIAIGILQRISLQVRRVQAIVVTRIKTEGLSRTSVLATIRRIEKIGTTIEAIGKYAHVKCSLAVPTRADEETGIQSEIANGAQVIVGTPSRVSSIIRRRLIDPFGVRILVLEEADEVANDDPDDESHELEAFSRIYAAMPDDIQVVMFASVLTSKLGDYIYIKDLRPLRITLSIPYHKVRHYSKTMVQEAKEEELRNLLNKFADCGKIIVFTRHFQQAIIFHDEYAHENALDLHYNNEKNERYETIAQFVKGNSRLLFSTDNLPYGALKGGEVSLIINYDFPTRRNYAHRFFRAGFSDSGGTVINFVVEEDSGCMAHVIDFYHITIDPLPDDFVPASSGSVAS